MKITSQSSIRTIRSDDPGFLIKEKFTVAPRAGFEINTKCPYEYKLIIQECLRNGWLKPVAHVTDKEFTFMSLANSK